MGSSKKNRAVPWRVRTGKALAAAPAWNKMVCVQRTAGRLPPGPPGMAMCTVFRCMRRSSIRMKNRGTGRKDGASRGGTTDFFRRQTHE